mmetsp:Transcript_158/g.328  ORF Transcript_158/g.328 Transcript_158/m.328 type:complete len:213 (-) Transcript_158:623-1261(-)
MIVRSRIAQISTSFTEEMAVVMMYRWSKLSRNRTSLTMRKRRNKRSNRISCGLMPAPIDAALSKMNARTQDKSSIFHPCRPMHKFFKQSSGHLQPTPVEFAILKSSGSGAGMGWIYRYLRPQQTILTRNSKRNKMPKNQSQTWKTTSASGHTSLACAWRPRNCSWYPTFKPWYWHSQHMTKALPMMAKATPNSNSLRFKNLFMRYLKSLVLS